MPRATRCRSRRRARRPTARSSARRSSCRGRALSPDVWVADGQPHTWNDGDIALTAIGVRRERAHRPQHGGRAAAEGTAAERRRPRSPRPRSARSKRSSTGATPTTCKRPNGAEAPDYQAAGSKYVPTNAPFESVGELQRVLGVTPALMARIAPTPHRLLAAARHQPGDRAARRAARDAERRRRNRSTPSSPRATKRSKNQLPVPPFPPAQGFAAGASPVWRIHVVARDARWCNLRPRRRAPPVGRSAASACHPALAGGGAGAGTPDPPPTGNICAAKWNRQALISGNGCALAVAPPRPPRVLALVGGRARAADPAPVAQRGRADAHAARAGVRGGRRRAVGAARSRTAVSRTRKSARIPLSADADATQRRDAPRSKRFAAGAEGGRIPPRVVVALPPEQVLRKTITLPAAVEENLRQVLAYDLDRHTPFKPEEVYFDASDRRARRRQEGDARRLGGGAQDGRRSVAAARRKLGRGGGRRHARSPVGGAAPARMRAQPPAAGGAPATPPRRAAGRSGCRSR